MNRQASAVHIIRLFTEQVEKLGIAHRNEKVKGIVRVGHDDEQGGFPVAQRVQLQLVIGRQFPKLLNVKGRKPCAAGNQDALSCLARDEKSRTFSSNSKRSHILRTSSRSRRLILSSIVSFAVLPLANLYLAYWRTAKCWGLRLARPSNI